MEDLRNYINQIRRDFTLRKLDENELGNDPFRFFASWMEEAIDAQILDPYAMCLSTVSVENKPSSRIVYLRDIINDGFVFYTNYNSKKGQDLERNPYASLNFHWGEIERQVRIDGKVEKLDQKISDAYFAKRPRESKIGAWASSQSKEILSRQSLEESVQFYQDKFTDDVPRPPHWGGYILFPESFEFWQGRPNRLHDRICLEKDGLIWKKARLSP